MANDTKIHFFTKSGDPETPQIIYMQFSYYKRMKFSIGEKIKPILWNKDLERCIISNSLTQAQERHAKRVNKYIEHIEKEVSVRLSNKNKFIPNPSYWDISYIKQHVKKVISSYKEKAEEEKTQKELTPTEYFTQYIASLPHRVIKRTGLYMSANTIEHHKIVLKRYEKFISDRRWVDRFELFDKKFETLFETWCYKSQNYTPNTIATSFSIMKVWLNQAEEDGLIKTRDFHTWKSKSDCKKIPLFTMYDGWNDVFSFIRENNIKLAIVSDTHELTIETVITHFDIPCKDFIGHFGAKRKKKPNPFPMNEALNLMGENANNVLSFGDSLNDFKAATAANIEHFACLWASKDEELLRANNCKNFIDSPLQIIDMLKQSD